MHIFWYVNMPNVTACYGRFVFYEKIVLSLKDIDINIYNIISFKARIGPPEGKSLKIDTVFQNRLNAI